MCFQSWVLPFDVHVHITKLTRIVEKSNTFLLTILFYCSPSFHNNVSLTLMSLLNNSEMYVFCTRVDTLTGNEMIVELKRMGEGREEIHRRFGIITMYNFVAEPRFCDPQ